MSVEHFGVDGSIALESEGGTMLEAILITISNIVSVSVVVVRTPDYTLPFIASTCFGWQTPPTQRERREPVLRALLYVLHA